MASPDPPMGYTENNSATYLATGNPCLDFFFHVVPDTPSKELLERLEKAWAHHPLTALKLVCNLRGVRGTGKSNKEGFYTSTMWLHKHHPRTLACNVTSISDFGYFKDFLEILYRLLYGEDVRKEEKESWEGKKMEKRHVIIGRKLIKSTEDRKKVLLLRHDKTAEKARKALERYDRDPEFRCLHECVSGFFAKVLKSDIKSLKEGELNKISLAAKWCPSLNSSFDKATLICERIARKLFTREDYIEYSDLEEKHYAYRIRNRLRKEVLVPLREMLKLPEVYMCAKKWDKVPFDRVASLAMKVYNKLYYKHQKERFEVYLEKVKAGKSTMAAGALLPHEIIRSLGEDDGAEVAELQWKRMVDDLAHKGKLSNCMAISGVSGSMEGIPMEVSVALGLLIAELSEDPWKGKFITFSAEPQLQIVQGESLQAKTEFIRRMDLDTNTDFQKVFDLILEVATKGNLTPDQMINRLFVFSDMEFNGASDNSLNWNTDYEVIRRKYDAKGYGQVVPEIVFWNLKNSMSTPVPNNQAGVALVSGFSKNLMTVFLEEGEIESPVAVMEKAISGEEYQKLVIID